MNTIHSRNPIQSFIHFIALCAGFAISANALSQTTLFVDDDAAAGGNGLSWATALNDLQDALNIAAAPASGITEIRLAQGVYAPTQRTDPTDPRSATFQLLSGVALRGGYAGVGAPNPDMRDYSVFISTLTGDINGDDGPDFQNTDENAYHVVTGAGVNDSAVQWHRDVYQLRVRRQRVTARRRFLERRSSSTDQLHIERQYRLRLEPCAVRRLERGHVQRRR